MKKILWLLILTAFARCTATAQETTSQQKAWQAMHKLTQTYQQARLLSFDISYSYAAEDKPAQPLDSLRGQCKVNGTRYWSRLDETESVYDDTLLLMLFKEDNLMYLAKPTATQKASVNPIALLDSFFLKNTNTQYVFTENATEQAITITMPPGSLTKKATYYINKRTGYLSRMSSLVRADQLYDPSVQNLVSDAASVYVVVETVYTNYRQGAFDVQVFDMSRYFKKEGDAYIAVTPYNDYKVFLGSNGL